VPADNVRGKMLDRVIAFHNKAGVPIKSRSTRKDDNRYQLYCFVPNHIPIDGRTGKNQEMSDKIDQRGKNSQVSHFKPGVSGNPSGRPIGSRNAFSAAFIGDMQASWATHGPTVLDRVARSDPSRYLGIAASICPRDVSLSIEQRTGALSEQDLAILRACREAIAGANDMEPSQVLQHTLDALRSYSAKVIEGE
jgi:hypothetical protein